MGYTLPDLRYQKEAISPEKMLANLKKDLDLKISVGIWYYTPVGGRFHERYVKQATIEERLNMTAGFAKYGVTGLATHYPAEINEGNIDLYKKLEKQAGINVIEVPFSHFYDKAFEFGSLSSPIKESRDKAIEIAIGGLKIVKEIGARMAISWPGMDGYKYIHGKPYMHMWELFESAMATAMDEVPGVMMALEPKPYEPASNNIYRTTSEGILAVQRIEGKLKNPKNKELLKEGFVLAAMSPEVGHSKMAFEMAPAAYSLAGMEGRLADTQWNSQPDGNYDQDNNIGVVNPHEAMALLYSLWAMGYKEYYLIDINPENMPVEKAIEINCKALKRMKEKIAELPHEEIIDCHLNPHKNRGKLELILLDYM